MFKKLFMLFKIGRKLSISGAISSIYEIYNPPITIKIFFSIIGFSFETKKNNNNLSPGTKLSNALQGMGTTFIKLGQFLATRPDIIGENVAKELEKLQDKLPPFQLGEAKNILRKELEKENFDYVIPMDADGEDRPEELNLLFNKSKEYPNKVITADRIKRSEGPLFKFCYEIHKYLTYIFTGHLIKFGNYSCLPRDSVAKMTNELRLGVVFQDH